MTKILLVEDDKNLREIYGTRLYAEGYDIVSAGDGEEALAMAIRERPNLIISDVMMPKISGFDMLDILHTNTDTKDIPVIMMTALSSEDQRARGESLGATRYLVKSQVGIEDVVRTVHDVLRDVPGATPPSNTQTTNAAPQPSFTTVQQSQSQGQSQTSIPQRSENPRPATTPQQRPNSPVVAPPREPQQTQQQSATPVQSQTPPTPQTTQNNPLPTPIAPFSTQRPSNLGDRVLHPINQDANNPQDDVAAKMAAALSDESNQQTPQQDFNPTQLTPEVQPPQLPPQPSTTEQSYNSAQTNTSATSNDQYQPPEAQPAPNQQTPQPEQEQKSEPNQ